MAAVRYRLSRFGTIYLSPQIRQSKSLVVQVDQVAKRLEEYRSDQRIPSQSVWGYVTRRVGGSVFEQELPIRFQSQLLTIWDVVSQPILRAMCIADNAIYLDILYELAKKVQLPNTLPPLIPIPPKFAVTNVLGFNRPTSLSFTTLYESDFDVTLFYDDPLPAGDNCTSQIAPIPPLPPIEDFLPSPGGTGAQPVPPSVPSLPIGSPPLGGTSFVPPSSLPGDNQPASNLTSTVVTIVVPEYYDPTGAGCSTPLSGSTSVVLPGVFPASEFTAIDTTPQGLPPAACPAVAVIKRFQAAQNGVPVPGTVVGPAEMGLSPYVVVTYQ